MNNQNHFFAFECFKCEAATVVNVGFTLYSSDLTVGSTAVQWLVVSMWSLDVLPVPVWVVSGRSDFLPQSKHMQKLG